MTRTGFWSKDSRCEIQRRGIQSKTTAIQQNLNLWHIKQNNLLSLRGWTSGEIPQQFLSQLKLYILLIYMCIMSWALLII